MTGAGYLIAIFYVTFVLLGFLKNEPGPVGNFIDNYNVYSDIPRWASLTVYLIPYVIPKYTNWVLDTFWWYPVYVPMAVLVYYLGLRGYVMAQQQPEEEKKEAGIYAALSEAEVANVRNILEDIMENRQAYLDPLLNLNTLAKQAELSPKMISAVLNGALQMGFNEFMNQYRIAAFKKMVCTAQSEKLTITGVAFNCGFNLQATFQRTFESVAGCLHRPIKNCTQKRI
jgi:AraC-like DNA-binding protein